MFPSFHPVDLASRPIPSKETRQPDHHNKPAGPGDKAEMSSDDCMASGSTCATKSLAAPDDAAQSALVPAGGATSGSGDCGSAPAMTVSDADIPDAHAPDADGDITIDDGVDMCAHDNDEHASSVSSSATTHGWPAATSNTSAGGPRPSRIHPDHQTRPDEPARPLLSAQDEEFLHYAEFVQERARVQFKAHKLYATVAGMRFRPGRTAAAADDDDGFRPVGGPVRGRSRRGDDDGGGGVFFLVPAGKAPYPPYRLEMPLGDDATGLFRCLPASMCPDEARRAVAFSGHRDADLAAGEDGNKKRVVSQSGAEQGAGKRPKTGTYGW